MEEATMPVIELASENFKEPIDGKGTVIIDFWAPWCAPYRSFAPTFEAASEKHTDVTFAKVNTEEQQELANALNIRSIPTLIVFREQIIIYADAGALPASTFGELIERVNRLDMDQVRADIGRPVVAYDHGGVDEQLRQLFPEGRVPLGDTERLRQTTKAVLTNHAEPRPVGEPLTLAAMCRAMLDTYRELHAA